MINIRESPSFHFGNAFLPVRTLGPLPRLVSSDSNCSGFFWFINTYVADESSWVLSLILHHLISLCCSLLFYSDLFFFSRGDLICVCFFGEPGAYQPSPVSGSSLIQELFLHKVCYPIIVNGLKWATASHVLSSVLWFQLTPHLLSPLQLSL